MPHSTNVRLNYTVNHERKESKTFQSKTAAVDFIVKRNGSEQHIINLIKPHMKKGADLTKLCRSRFITDYSFEPVCVNPNISWFEWGFNNWMRKAGIEPVKTFNVYSTQYTEYGGTRYLIFRITDADKLACSNKERIMSILGIKYYSIYSGPGRYFQHSASLEFRQNYIIVRQCFGYDI